MEHVNSSVDLIVYAHGGRPLAELTRLLGVPEGATIALAKDVHLMSLGPLLPRSQDAPGVFRFLLNVGQDVTASVAAAVAANWLYRKLKHRRPNVKISIEKTVVEMEAGQIKRVIEEKLRMERVHARSK
jgi:hypothetical protein